MIGEFSIFKQIDEQPSGGRARIMFCSSRYRRYTARDSPGGQLIALCSIWGVRRYLVGIIDREEWKGKGVTVNPFASGMAAATAGVALAVAADAAITRLRPSLRNPVAACGLIGAAAVYPLSGRRLGIDGREALTLALASIVAALVASMPSSRQRRLLAAGWVAHALYDAAFTHDTNATRLPEWYAPFCAGVDIAMGARLALPNPQGASPIDFEF